MNLQNTTYYIIIPLNLKHFKIENLTDILSFMQSYLIKLSKIYQ